MSGLETAIRNALDRSDRADGKTRARIYQSARQALEAGLQKQGVTDVLIVLQQRKRLEEKIREIETEEVDRLTVSAGRYDEELEDRVSDFEPVVEPDRPAGPAPAFTASDAAIELGGATRQAPAEARHAPAVTPDVAGDLGGVDAPRLGSASDFGNTRDFGSANNPASAGDVAEEPQAPAKAGRGRRGRRQLDIKPERAAKPRRRRSFLSRLITWVITLAIVAGGCWWFYTTGMVQSVMQDALEAANRATRGQGQSNSRFDPRGGFSDEWVEIFKPSDVAGLRLGRQATAEAADGSDGPAVRLLSATPAEDGNVALTVPADLLKEMAGKSSTIALTLQAGANQGIQVSVRCDFGSLGDCARHRFTASQEKQDALFNVNFERTLAPNAPGRLIINAGLDGPAKPVLLYSVRILPGR